jgi:hypothetical protein
MASISQQRALNSHRRRMAERGVCRYEVRGLERDKDLVRRFAMRLAADDEPAARLRDAVAREVLPPTLSGKEIWAALRRSPLVGIELNIDREFATGRDIDL